MNKKIEIDVFNDVIKDGVTVVDFYATWCQPCSLLHPIMEELSKEYEGKVVFLQIDVDDNDELCGAFDVDAIPAVFIIKDGEVKDKFVGYRLKREIKPMIDKYL